MEEQGVSQDVAEKVSCDVAEKVSCDVAEKVSCDVAEKVSCDVAEKVSCDVAEKVSCDVAEKVANSLLKDEEQNNKLLKLMGGCKAKNKQQAQKWLARNRTEEEEKDLKANMQNYFQHCHEKKTNGDTRRRQGLGFSNPPQLDNEDGLEAQRRSSPETTSSVTAESSKTERQPRNRSRSPIHRSRSNAADNRGRLEKEAAAAPVNNQVNTKKSLFDQIKKDKKSFYSQFKKSSG